MSAGLSSNSPDATLGLRPRRVLAYAVMLLLYCDPITLQYRAGRVSSRSCISALRRWGLNTADALRVRTHKLECTRCLLRVLADFSVHGVKVPARNGQIW